MQWRGSIETTSRTEAAAPHSKKENSMKTLMTAALLLGFVGLASAAQAHRPTQSTTVECPSSKDWARCFWQEMDKNPGG